MIQTIKTYLSNLFTRSYEPSQEEIDEHKRLSDTQARLQMAIDEPVTPVKRKRGRPRKTPEPTKA